ncbi:ArsR/SmtB family transcription factor [Georgenia sp. Z1344]|uniref:ArsR/SmtB family transcription factor n=1 Tax=Georgenia sp. Z1344 TaxID=3416706 RepID=UPI003CF0A62C
MTAGATRQTPGGASGQSASAASGGPAVTADSPGGPRSPGDPDSPAPLFAALADETRWEVLRAVGRAPSSASELARTLPVSRQAIAHHLETLAQFGLVEAAREGRHLRYRALGARLTQLATALESIGRGWDERLDRLAALAEARAADGAEALPGGGTEPDGGVARGADTLPDGGAAQGADTLPDDGATPGADTLPDGEAAPVLGEAANP